MQCVMLQFALLVEVHRYRYGRARRSDQGATVCQPTPTGLAHRRYDSMRWRRLHATPPLHMQRMPQRTQRDLLRRLAQGGMRVDGGSHILQAGPHLDRLRKRAGQF